MTSFKDREQSFENKYAHEEKLGFDIEAKASKIFGLWVAEQIGLTDTDAQTYAKKIVEVNLEEPGFEDIFREVRKDLQEKNIEISDHILHVELDKAVHEAKVLVMKDKS